MSYSFQAGLGWNCSSCSKAFYKPVWHIPLLSVQWINSWWWTEELSETCRVSCQKKFVKLVHLVGFILFFFSPGATTPIGLACLIKKPRLRGFLITHDDAPHPVGLLWMNDQSVAETSTWQHTTLTTDKYPCPGWDSNPQSQQVSGQRPTP